MTAQPLDVSPDLGARGQRPGRRRNSSAQPARGERTRDREVVDAAIAVFWEKGYANASVQDVADVLGMLKGSLYYYIDSKESLLRRIFVETHQELMDLAAAAQAEPGPAVDQLRWLLRASAMWAIQSVDRAGLYFREWRYASDGLNSELVRERRGYEKVIARLVAAWQADGDLDAVVDPMRAATFVWSAISSLPDSYAPRSRLAERGVAESYVALAMRAVGLPAD